MENAIYIALSKQTALTDSMQIIANNVANANTTGYRAQNILFEEFISDPRFSDDDLSFVNDFGQYQNSTQGGLTQTDNDLNVALSGPGFLSIQLQDGRTAYTRDGNFQLAGDGTLLNQSGLPVLGSGGPIIIPDSSTEINIDQNGNISDQDGTIAQLQIFEFANIEELEPFGENAYITDGATTPAENTIVSQGFLEESNVNAIAETTRMITVLREFQATHGFIEQENERLLGAIRTLTET